MRAFLQQLFTRERTIRIWAGLIDLGALAVLLALCALLTGRPDFKGVADSFRTVSAFTGDTAGLQELVIASALQFQGAFVLCLWTAFLYEVFFTLLPGGGTPGKRLMGLRLIPMKNGGNYLLTAWKVIVRSGMKYLSLYLFQGFPFLMSVLYIFADEQNRAGHDRAARMKVVRSSEVPVPLVKSA